MKPLALAGLAVFFNFVSIAAAQTRDSQALRRANTFTVFAEYSNDSSHMLMGVAEDRKLAAVGASYARRLWSSRAGDLRYLVEVRPVLLESDPVTIQTAVFTAVDPPGPGTTQVSSGPPYISCKPGSFQETVQTPTQSYLLTVTTTCDRRWTFAQGLSPVGLQYSFLPRRRIQPFVSSTAGYIFSTRPIPISDAGSFNFTFDFGAGIEFFHSRSRSIQFEYRYHHISNHDTADANPGIDNGVFKLSYAFGR